jgi:hypothetical protein
LLGSIATNLHVRTMRKATTVAVLTILVVASFGAGYLARSGPGSTTSTSISTSTLTSQVTVTSTSTSTSTEVVPFVPDAATAVGSNGTSGIDLVLGVNATNLKVGQRLGVEVSLFNPLTSANSVPIFTANDWPWGHPGQNNFSGIPVIFGDPCNAYAFVRAVVLKGDYTPQELPSAANSSLSWQCAEGEAPENMTFSPESSLADATASGNVALAPRIMSTSFTTDGYWDLSNFSRQVNQPLICPSCQNPPVATPFVPDVYTLAVSDQWGQVAALHFAVGDYSGEVVSSLSDAVGYLIGVGSFDPGLRLIPETPGSTTYWLYSDNYLAALALQQYGRGNATITSIANYISQSLASYAILDHLGDAVNQYMALNASVPCTFNASQNYIVGSMNADKIMATFNNGTGTLSENQYADIAFLSSICLYRQGDTAGAVASYDTGKAMFDGFGLNDSVFANPGPDQGQYQTFKLALYVYSSALLHQPVDPSAVSVLLSMQAPGGGFYTGYDSSLSHEGTSTNTETTSLAILALDAISGG